MEDVDSPFMKKKQKYGTNKCGNSYRHPINIEDSSCYPAAFKNFPAESI
jgi:hypothetical protein